MNSLGCALVDDVAPWLPAPRPQVDEVVRGQHDVFVVLYHQHGIANCGEIFEGFDQSLVVPLMKADAGLIQDVGDAC